MENRVILNIKTKNGDYVIPFLDISKLDDFTVGFENESEMIEGLNRALDLSIDNKDVKKVYLSSDKDNVIKKRYCTCIKYNSDNWDFESLKNLFTWFLKQDHRRIRATGVRFVNTRDMVGFQAGEHINDRAIETAVKIFLMSDYKCQRDAYFMIKNFGNVKVNGRIPYLKFENNCALDYDVNNNEFIQSLIRVANANENQLDMILESLSAFDLKTIGGSLENRETDLIRALVENTGMNIKELKDIQPGNGYDDVRKLGRNR